MPGLHPLPDYPSVPQLAAIDLELEHHHAILPAMQEEHIGRACVFEGDDDVVGREGRGVREGGGEILALFVSDGVVRLLYAVAVQQLHPADTDVKQFSHQVILFKQTACPDHPSFAQITFFLCFQLPDIGGSLGKYIC